MIQRLVLLAVAFGVMGFLAPGQVLVAQDEPAKTSDDGKQQDDESSPAIEALRPLFDQVAEAKSTRVTVELTVDTVVDGAVINSQSSSYQIAANAPGQFTIYLKADQQRTRIYCDGETTTIALSESAYVEQPNPIPMRLALFQLPIPMGPYPEAALALSLAGVDPALTLTSGVKSVSKVGNEKFRGKTPSVHFAGIQEDDVKWDLWITRDETPKPLRLKVDLTEMLRANGDLELPAGYQYTLRFDYKVWLIDHENDPSLYRYAKIKGAKKYESIEDYFKQQAAAKAKKN